MLNWLVWLRALKRWWLPCITQTLSWFDCWLYLWPWMKLFMAMFAAGAALLSHWDYIAAVGIVVHACVLLFKCKGHIVGWQCVINNKGIVCVYHHVFVWAYQSMLAHVQYHCMLVTAFTALQRAFQKSVYSTWWSTWNDPWLTFRPITLISRCCSPLIGLIFAMYLTNNSRDYTQQLYIPMPLCIE